MSNMKENRFVKEVREAAKGNPNVDIELARKWQAVIRELEGIPSLEPEKKAEIKKPRLQPIPLRMFSRTG